MTEFTKKCIKIKKNELYSLPYDYKPYCDLIEEFYNLREKNSCGGNLHIVLDDDNVETYHISSCIDSCIEDNDIDGIALASLLLQFGEADRLRIIEHWTMNRKNI
jgi:hypothetical protein